MYFLCRSGYVSQNLSVVNRLFFTTILLLEIAKLKRLKDAVRGFTAMAIALHNVTDAILIPYLPQMTFRFCTILVILYF